MEYFDFSITKQKILLLNPLTPMSDQENFSLQY